MSSDEESGDSPVASVEKKEEEKVQDAKTTTVKDVMVKEETKTENKGTSILL